MERLPRAVRGIADEIRILFPWGSLLRALTTPDADVLHALAGLGKPGARVIVRINMSGMDEPCAGSLAASYARCGIALRRCEEIIDEGTTSWGRRLNGGRPLRVLALDGALAVATGDDG